MKKRYLAILTIILALIAVLTSCSMENTEPEATNDLGCVSFTMAQSRALTPTYAMKSYSDLYWFYTAEKKDQAGFTGQTSTQVKINGTPTNEDPGLGTVNEEFSLGRWVFKLYAYTAIDSSKNPVGTPVYSGSSATVTLSSTGTTTVPVSVSPGNGPGYIDISGAYFKWTEASKTDKPYIRVELVGSSSKLVTTITPENKTAENTFPLGSGNLVMPVNSTPTAEIPAGFYTCNFTVLDTDMSKIVATSSISLRVVSGATTKISGNIEQATSEITGTDANNKMVAVSNSSATVGIAPAGGETQTTEVSFNASDLTTADNTTNVLNIEITDHAEANGAFQIINTSTAATDSEVAIASIDLSMTQITTTEAGTTQNPVTQFNNGVTITTYIAKNLSSVAVRYVNDSGQINESEQPKYSYNSGTGELTITTKHFSNFIVTVKKADITVADASSLPTIPLSAISGYEGQDGNAYLFTSGTYTFSSAFNAANLIYIPEGAVATLDLKGYSLTGKAVGYAIDNRGNLIIKDSTNTTATDWQSVTTKSTVTGRILMSLGSSLAIDGIKLTNSTNAPKADMGRGLVYSPVGGVTISASNSILKADGEAYGIEVKLESGSNTDPVSISLATTKVDLTSSNVGTYVTGGYGSAAGIAVNYDYRNTVYENLEKLTLKMSDSAIIGTELKDSKGNYLSTINILLNDMDQVEGTITNCDITTPRNHYPILLNDCGSEAVDSTFSVSGTNFKAWGGGYMRNGSARIAMTYDDCTFEAVNDNAGDSNDFSVFSIHSSLNCSMTVKNSNISFSRTNDSKANMALFCYQYNNDYGGNSGFNFENCTFNFPQGYVEEQVFGSIDHRKDNASLDNWYTMDDTSKANLLALLSGSRTKDYHENFPVNSALTVDYTQYYLTTLEDSDTTLFERGRGTELNPYVITSQTHLLNIGDSTIQTRMKSGEYIHFKLESDISLDGLSGDYAVRFLSGELYGDGHTITGSDELTAIFFNALWSAKIRYATLAFDANNVTRFFHWGPAIVPTDPSASGTYTSPKAAVSIVYEDADYVGQAGKIYQIGDNNFGLYVWNNSNVVDVVIDDETNVHSYPKNIKFGTSNLTYSVTLEGCDVSGDFVGGFGGSGAAIFFGGQFADTVVNVEDCTFDGTLQGYKTALFAANYYDCGSSKISIENLTGGTIKSTYGKGSLYYGTNDITLSGISGATYTPVSASTTPTISFDATSGKMILNDTAGIANATRVQVKFFLPSLYWFSDSTYTEQTQVTNSNTLTIEAASVDALPAIYKAKVMTSYEWEKLSTKTIDWTAITTESAEGYKFTFINENEEGSGQWYLVINYGDLYRLYDSDGVLGNIGDYGIQKKVIAIAFKDSNELLATTDCIDIT